MAHPVAAEDKPVSAAPATESRPPVADAVASPPPPLARSSIPLRVALDPDPVNVGEPLRATCSLQSQHNIRRGSSRTVCSLHRIHHVDSTLLT